MFGAHLSSNLKYPKTAIFDNTSNVSLSSSTLMLTIIELLVIFWTYWINHAIMASIGGLKSKWKHALRTNELLLRKNLLCLLNSFQLLFVFYTNINTTS